MDTERFPVAKVFLCHSSADKVTVRRVGGHLRKANLDIWVDEREIKPGDSLVEKISEGLSTTNYILVFLSKASTRSRWVKREINAALMRSLEADDIKIIPIVIEDCEVPPLLLELVHIDIRANFDRAMKKLIDAIRPPFPVDLSDNPHLAADRLPGLEHAISESMTAITRLIADYGLNHPDKRKAARNTERFLAWYENNRESLASYEDPRLEDLDYIYWSATGKTVGGQPGSKPPSTLISAEPEAPESTSRKRFEDAIQTERTMSMRAYDGKTTIVVLPDARLIHVTNQPPKSASSEVTYDFDGQSISAPRAADPVGTIPRRKVVFEFTQRMALIQVSYQMCDQADIEDGAILDIDTEDGRYFFRPLFVAPGCTIGYVDLDVYESTKGLWGIEES